VGFGAESLASARRAALAQSQQYQSGLMLFCCTNRAGVYGTDCDDRLPNPQPRYQWIFDFAIFSPLRRDEGDDAHNNRGLNQPVVFDPLPNAGGGSVVG